MEAQRMIRAIWGAGFVHLGIIAGNVPLPGPTRSAAMWAETFVTTEDTEDGTEEHAVRQEQSQRN